MLAVEWLLIGGGGHGLSVADVVRRAGGKVVAVVDPRPDLSWQIPVELSLRDALRWFDSDGGRVIVSLGDCATRGRLSGELVAGGLELGTVLASTATISADVGRGSVVMEHAHVGPRAVVSEGVIVNTAAVVEHDCEVGAFSHVAPGAVLLGGVRVGPGTLIGAGAVVLPGVVVGARAVVGAGSVITSNVPDGWRIVGNPGRRTLRGE